MARFYPMAASQHDLTVAYQIHERMIDDRDEAIRQQAVLVDEQVALIAHQDELIADRDNAIGAQARLVDERTRDRPAGGRGQRAGCSAGQRHLQLSGGLGPTDRCGDSRQRLGCWRSRRRNRSRRCGAPCQRPCPSGSTGPGVDVEAHLGSRLDRAQTSSDPRWTSPAQPGHPARTRPGFRGPVGHAHRA